MKFIAFVKPYLKVLQSFTYLDGSKVQISASNLFMLLKGT